MKKSLLLITLVTIFNIFTLSSKDNLREGGINRRDRERMERLNQRELVALNIALREQLNQLTQEVARHNIATLARQAVREQQEPVELRAPQSLAELQALQRRLSHQGVTLTIIPAPARGPAEENNTEEPARQESPQR